MTRPKNSGYFSLSELLDGITKEVARADASFRWRQEEMVKEHLDQIPREEVPKAKIQLEIARSLAISKGKLTFDLAPPRTPWWRYFFIFFRRSERQNLFRFADRSDSKRVSVTIEIQRGDAGSWQVQHQSSHPFPKDALVPDLIGPDSRHQ